MKNLNATNFNLTKDFFQCMGMDRNMYVTITRVKVGSSNTTKSELAAEARVMQAVNDQADYLSLIFTNTPDLPSGAKALAATLFAVLALCLSLF